MNRREFLQLVPPSLCAASVFGALSLEGCAASDEAAAIIDATLPMVQGISAVVALADPVMAPAIAAAVALYTGAVKEFDTIYAQWKAAPPDQQPTVFAKVQAAAALIGQNLTGIFTASRVLNAEKQNTIQLLYAAASSAVAEVINLVGVVKGAGGTTNALNRLMEEGAFGGGQEPKSSTKAAKSSIQKAPVTAKHLKSDLAKKLALKSGDPQLDAVRADIAAKLKQ